MEAWNYDDVQISKMIWEKMQNSNLVQGLLVPSEDARKRALKEIAHAVEHYIVNVESQDLHHLINSERVSFVDLNRRDGRAKLGLRERNNSDSG